MEVLSIKETDFTDIFIPHIMPKMTDKQKAGFCREAMLKKENYNEKVHAIVHTPDLAALLDRNQKHPAAVNYLSEMILSN